MRAIWSGAIGFGLVNIPIKLYSAVQESSLDLDMLDKSDLSNISFKRVNASTGKEVKYENIVRAYKLEDEYVVLDKEDFEAVSPEKSRLFSIRQFVKNEEVDSAYFETSYFLEPQKNAEEPYRLLLEALKMTEMCGVGRFILREKEIIGLIRPYQDKILILHRMRFPEEIRDFDELKIPKAKKPNEDELKMATSLIKQLSQEFDPDKYKNTYAEDLLKIIKDKAKGVKRKEVKEDEKPVKTIDLMAQLKASLEAAKSDKKAS